MRSYHCSMLNISSVKLVGNLGDWTVMLCTGMVKLPRSEQEGKARETKRYPQKATKWVSKLSLQRNETLL